MSSSLIGPPRHSELVFSDLLGNDCDPRETSRETSKLHPYYSVYIPNSFKPLDNRFGRVCLVTRNRAACARLLCHGGVRAGQYRSTQR